MELFHAIMFRDDNTEGYTPAELTALNNELGERIKHLDEDDSNEAYEIAKSFADEVSGRL